MPLLPSRSSGSPVGPRSARSTATSSSVSGEFDGSRSTATRPKSGWRSRIARSLRSHEGSRSGTTRSGSLTTNGSLSRRRDALLDRGHAVVRRAGDDPVEPVAVLGQPAPHVGAARVVDDGDADLLVPRPLAQRGDGGDQVLQAVVGEQDDVRHLQGRRTLHSRGRAVPDLPDERADPSALSSFPGGSRTPRTTVPPPSRPSPPRASAVPVHTRSRRPRISRLRCPTPAGSP